MGRKHTTRRAPHMQKYVRVRKSRGDENPWKVDVNIGSQTFSIGDGCETKSAALWTRDMLCIALDEICKDRAREAQILALEATK